jgi:hypothetical protein
MNVAAASTLVGLDIGQAAARLGPPLSCAAVGDEVHLGYLGSAGELIPDGLVLVDGVVVRAKAGQRSPPALHGYWIGQPVERLLPNFGAVVATVPGPVLQELVFAAFRVCVHEGRVVLVQPRSLTRAS